MNESTGQILLITGGVGGAKLSLGFSKVYDSNSLSFIVNTADDFEYLGLRICPDIDTLLYNLSSQVDIERGWGVSDETWNCLDSLGQLGCETWFKLGDRDLATHVYRSYQMTRGRSLSEVTLDIARKFLIKSLIMPMSDDSVRTTLRTDQGDLDFQDYFVHKQCIPLIRSISLDNVETSRPSPVLQDYFANTSPQAIIICPSNPFLSIDPILSVPGLCKLILDSHAPVLAVSPIVNGDSLKGPTAKILTEFGMSVCAFEVARYYQNKYPGLISTFIIDNSDRELIGKIQELGIDVFATDIIMNSERKKKALAESLVNLCM